MFWACPVWQGAAAAREDKAGNKGSEDPSLNRAGQGFMLPALAFTFLFHFKNIIGTHLQLHLRLRSTFYAAVFRRHESNSHPTHHREADQAAYPYRRLFKRSRRQCAQVLSLARSMARLKRSHSRRRVPLLPLGLPTSTRPGACRCTRYNLAIMV